jgi:hypothetical protein
VTDPETEPAVDAAPDVPPMSSEKATEVVENDPALQETGADEPDES